MDPDPGGPKTCGSGSGFGSGILLFGTFSGFAMVRIYIMVPGTATAKSYGFGSAMVLHRVQKGNWIWLPGLRLRNGKGRMTSACEEQSRLRSSIVKGGRPPAASDPASADEGSGSRDSRFTSPPTQHHAWYFQPLAVLRIHDIFVWIRIRISMPLTNGSGCGSGSCFFHHWPSRRHQKSTFWR